MTTYRPFVKADPDRLPYGWQHDPHDRERIWAEIRALHRRGVSQRQIAMQVGVSSRGVNRVLHRESGTVHRCGADRRAKRAGAPCTTLVPAAGVRCWRHR